MQLFIDSNHLSPYAMSVFVALREKGISFEKALVNLQAAEHLATTYGGISTTRRVPAINDNGFHLSESSAICEYLDEKYPSVAIYPKDNEQRAKAREIQAWLRSDLMAIRQERPTEVIFLERSLPPLTKDGLSASKKLFNAVEQLLPANQQSLFYHWSIADTDLALMLTRLVRAGDEVPERLAQYAQFQWQRPSESPRDLWRLQPLRRWSHEQEIKPFFPRST